MDADAAEAGAVNGAVSPDQLAQQAQEIVEEQTRTDAEEQRTQTGNRALAEEQTRTDAEEQRAQTDNRALAEEQETRTENREIEQTRRNMCKVLLLVFVLVFAICAIALLLWHKQSGQAHLWWNIAVWFLAVVIILALVILTFILWRCICPLWLPLWLQPNRDAAPAVANHAGPELGAGALPLPTAASRTELAEPQPVDRAAPGGSANPILVDQSACQAPRSSGTTLGVQAPRGYSGAAPRGHSEASGVSADSGMTEDELEPVFIVMQPPVPIPGAAGAIDMPAPPRGQAPESSGTALGEAAAPRGHSEASGAPGDTDSARSEVWSDPPPYPPTE